MWLVTTLTLPMLVGRALGQKYSELLKHTDKVCLLNTPQASLSATCTSRVSPQA